MFSICRSTYRAQTKNIVHIDNGDINRYILYLKGNYAVALLICSPVIGMGSGNEARYLIHGNTLFGDSDLESKYLIGMPRSWFILTKLALDSRSVIWGIECEICRKEDRITIRKSLIGKGIM